ncbi:MAG: hypothetical protein GF411_06830 [Candidatus Lokiarchaeota archaeon]|nr:hypothetical protein [Candidatus Lokiarchaeota archaeon]
MHYMVAVIGMMKVLVPYDDEELLEIMHEILDGHAEIIQSSRDIDSMLEAGSDVEIVTSGRVHGEFIRKSPHLRLIHSFGAGVNNIDASAVLEQDDLIVCNCHVNAVEVAEYAIMLLLSVAKNIIINDRTLRRGDWTYGWAGPRPNIEIRNKVCLIIGLGNIGSEIAKRLSCFNLTLIGVTHSGNSSHDHLVNQVVSINDLSPHLEEADFVILSLPLTKETRNLVDTDFISKMKSSSILINISRGGIVDESALYKALDSGAIFGAGIDVWWEYPSKRGGTAYPSNTPFHELDSVVMSPHRAAYSENIQEDQIRFVAENVLRFIKGESPHNIVDMTKGY